VSAAKKYLDALNDDSANTAAAKLWLKKQCVPEIWWDEFLRELAAARAFYELRMGAGQCTTRRAKIAERMKSFAAELDADPEVSMMYPHYRGELQLPTVSIDYVPFDGALSLADWLTDCAEHLIDERLLFQSQRSSLRRYLILRTYGALMGRWRAVNKNQQKLPRTPNDAIAGLVSALLGEPIDAKTVSNALHKKRSATLRPKIGTSR
jgi:hypothetical protein